MVVYRKFCQSILVIIPSGILVPTPLSYIVKSHARMKSILHLIRDLFQISCYLKSPREISNLNHPLMLILCFSKGWACDLPVITWLIVRFGINHSRWCFKILKSHLATLGWFQNFKTSTRVIYPKSPSRPCDYYYKSIL